MHLSVQKNTGQGTPREQREVKHVVILGGGVVGAAVAYYLRQTHQAAQGSGRQRGALPFDLELTIVESAAAATGRCACGELGCDDTSLHALGANSGSSSGFLQKDACDGTPVESLARQGFEDHVELGEHLERSADDRVDFRRIQRVLHAGTVGGSFGQEQAVYERPSPKAWAVVAQDGQIISGSTFCEACTTEFAAKTSETPTGGSFRDAVPCAQVDDRARCAAPMPAQIHPRKLCWALAKQSGAVIVSGTEVVGVQTHGVVGSAKVTAVRVRPSSDAGRSPSPAVEPEPEPEQEPELDQEKEQKASSQSLGEGQSIWPPSSSKSSTEQAAAHANDVSRALLSGQLSCTHVIVALGPWSAVAVTEAWFEQQELQLPLTAVVGQSLVVRPEEELLVGLLEGDTVVAQPVAITAAARELVLPPPLPIQEPACNATKVNLVHLGDIGSFVPFILPRPADEVNEVWVGGTAEPLGSVMRRDRSGNNQVMLKSAKEMAGGDGYESALIVGALRGAAVQVAPALAEAKHVSQSACVAAYTPDGLPVIGEVPRCGKLQASFRTQRHEYVHCAFCLLGCLQTMESFARLIICACRVCSRRLRRNGSR